MMVLAVRRLFRISPADVSGLVLAYWYLVLAGWRLFVLRERLNRWVFESEHEHIDDSGVQKQLQRLFQRARWVNAAARLPKPWARCLQRSVALCLWLERKGISPQIKIGVSREKSTLNAHAWVEYGGRVINDRPDVSRFFVPLANGQHLPPMGR